MTFESLLANAPVGSRAVRDFGYGLKLVVHKVAPGYWQNGISDPVLPVIVVDEACIVDEWCEATVFLHLPGKIKLWQWWVGGDAYYSWECRACPGYELSYEDPSEAHDTARRHVVNEHAQVKS